METRKKMDMEQFAESIRERLEQLGQFEKVSLRNISKNNGIMRCGLPLHNGGKNLGATIYLESFFEAYDNGADMEEITGEILKLYESSSCEEIDMSFFQERSMVKDRLCFKLVNREANAELLAKVPYREFLDLAVVYYVDFHDPQIGTGIIQIDNFHMKKWGVTEDDLWEAARINTPERKKEKIAGMDTLLAELFLEEKIDDSDCYDSCMREAYAPMLVITNTEKQYGAAVVLYDGALKHAADKMNSDLFVLPSSLHEVIAVPVTGGKNAAEFKEMVMTVNRTILPPEEMLSDNVYIYRRGQNRLEMA